MDNSTEAQVHRLGIKQAIQNRINDKMFQLREGLVWKDEFYQEETDMVRELGVLSELYIKAGCELYEAVNKALDVVSDIHGTSGAVDNHLIAWLVHYWARGDELRVAWNAEHLPGYHGMKVANTYIIDVPDED